MLQISAHTRALAVTNAADTLHVALPPHTSNSSPRRKRLAQRPAKPSAGENPCTAPSSTPSRKAATTNPTR